MDGNEANLILERWIARMAESYPRNAAALLSQEPDPFRNPVGCTLRRNLSLLLSELCGEMNAPAIDSALDQIVRLHVAQGTAPDDAVRFVSLLQPILRGLVSGRHSAVFDSRIDRLVAIAADKHKQCREQLARIRAHELQRAGYVPQRIRARRPA